MEKLVYIIFMTLRLLWLFNFLLLSRNILNNFLTSYLSFFLVNPMSLAERWWDNWSRASSEPYICSGANSCTCNSWAYNDNESCSLGKHPGISFVLSYSFSMFHIFHMILFIPVCINLDMTVAAFRTSLLFFLWFGWLRKFLLILVFSSSILTKHVFPNLLSFVFLLYSSELWYLPLFIKQNALRQQRFVREVTIQYNLCNEPW